MKKQSFYKSPLTIWGLILAVAGLILNIKMFVENDYPTYLYFILISVGIAFVCIDRLIRRTEGASLTSKLIMQISFIVLPPLVIYAKLYIIDPRAEVIIAPKGFEGPIAIIYSVPGFPPVERKTRDLIIRLPQSGVFITSSKQPESIRLETYFVDSNDSGYGKETLIQSGGSGGTTSQKCGMSFNYFSGYISDKLMPEPAFDRETFITRLTDSLCNSNVLTKGNAAGNMVFMK